MDLYMHPGERHYDFNTDAVRGAIFRVLIEACRVVVRPMQRIWDQDLVLTLVSKAMPIERGSNK